MVRPERRTKGDLVAAATIALVVVVVAGLIWWTQLGAGHRCRPVRRPAPRPPPPRGRCPTRCSQLWTATSRATLAPVVVGGTVVTGDGPHRRRPRPADRTDAGRSGATAPATPADLCGVSYVYDLAVAVYPDVRGCGQVSAINAATGQRGADPHQLRRRRRRAELDGSAVLVAPAPPAWNCGARDLVRMLSYGEIDAPVKPVNTRRRYGLRADVGGRQRRGASSVLEACRDEKDLRLTLLQAGQGRGRARHQATCRCPGSPATPRRGCWPCRAPPPRCTCRHPQPEIAVYDDTGTKVSEHPAGTTPCWPTPAQAVTSAGDVITWWTGDSVDGVRQQARLPLHHRRRRRAGARWARPR